MKYLKNKNIFLFYITLLPIVFIGRFTFEMHLHNSKVSINYVFILLAMTILILLLKNGISFVLSFAQFLITSFKFLFPIYILILIDLLTISTHPITSNALVAFIKKLAVYFLFIFTTYMWFNIPKKQTTVALNKLTNTWNLIFCLDILISILQVLDCYFFNCVNTMHIQKYFTSSALPPTHQMFGYYSPTRTNHIRILRPPGIFGDTNYNGMFLVLSLILFFIEYINIYNNKILTTLKNKKASVLILKTILAIFILLLTFSRSAILGIVIFLPYLIIQTITNIKVLIKPILLSASTILLAIYVLFIIYPGSLVFIARRLNIKKDPSSLTHEKLFKESQKIIKRYPPKLLGNGLDSYNTLYQNTIRHTKRKTNPHSIWVQTYIEQGLLGVGGLIILGAHLITYTYKDRNSYSNFSIATMLNLAIPYFLIVGFVYYGFFMPFVWAWGLIPNDKFNKI